MTPTHTPGPWGIRYAQNLTAITTPKGEMQLSLHGVHDGLKPLSASLQEWEANAAYIVRACNNFDGMLAALKLLQAVKGPVSFDNGWATLEDGTEICLNDIIEQAQGKEQP